MVPGDFSGLDCLSDGAMHVDGEWIGEHYPDGGDIFDVSAGH